MTRSNLFKLSLVVSNIFLVASCSKISDFLLKNPQLQYHMLAVGNVVYQRLLRIRNIKIGQ